MKDNEAVLPVESNSYLIKENIPDKAYDVFSQMMGEGYKGICITRANPSAVRKKFGRSANIVMLSNKKIKEYATCTDISDVAEKIAGFIKSNKKSAILLDRLDYLINMYGFGNVMKLIYNINEDIMMNKAIFMLNVNPNTLSQQEISLLEQEFKDIPKSKKSEVYDITDDIHEILNYVNNNERISFKNVSKQFSITKTTTRKRINKMETAGLVVVKKNGRNKIVKLTEMGRKLL